MAFERFGQHDARCEQLAEPSEERFPARRRRARHATRAIHGGLHSQRRGAAQGKRRVCGLSAVTREDQLRRDRAVVETRRDVRGEAPRDSRDSKAVVGAPARRLDSKASAGRKGPRPREPYRVGGQSSLEPAERSRRHERRQANVLKLRIAAHRVHRFGPAIEVGGCRPRVAAEEGTGGDDQVFLVLDRLPDACGHLHRGGLERHPLIAGVRAGDGTRPEHGRKRSCRREHGGDRRPKGFAPSGASRAQERPFAVGGGRTRRVGGALGHCAQHFLACTGGRAISPDVRPLALRPRLTPGLPCSVGLLLRVSAHRDCLFSIPTGL